MTKGIISKILPNYIEVTFHTDGPNLNLKNKLTAVVDGEELIFEVNKLLGNRVVSAIPMDNNYNLILGIEVTNTDSYITVPIGANILGRVMNHLGDPIDEKGAITTDDTSVIHKSTPDYTDMSTEDEILQTGIKVIDLLAPLSKGRKTGILGGAGVGKTVIIMELINNIAKASGGFSIFIDIARRIRETNDLYNEMIESGIIDPENLQNSKMTMVSTGMSEAPGAIVNAVYTGTTLAEYFRDNENQDVLLFVDDIANFIKANNELSTELLEDGNSIDTFQKMANFQERICTNNNGSITSFQTIKDRSLNDNKDDNLIDFSAGDTIKYIDSTIILSRKIAELGIYPAVDPINSQSLLLDPNKIGEDHYDTAKRTRELLYQYNQLKDIIAINGMDDLTKNEKTIVNRARKIQRFCSQPFHVAEVFTGQPGVLVSLEDTIQGFKKILNGDGDDIHEHAFYMVGTFDEVIEKNKELIQNAKITKLKKHIRNVSGEII